MKNNKIVLLIGSMLILSGCAKKSPVPGISVSMQDAKQAIAAAQTEIDEAGKVGADVTEPQNVLNSAKDLLKKRYYGRAKNSANLAGKIARHLKEDILAELRNKEDAAAAIERAHNLIEKAGSSGGDVSEPEKIVAQAKVEYGNKKHTRSIELADRAAEMAQDIINSQKFEKYVVGTWEADRDCL